MPEEEIESCSASTASSLSGEEAGSECAGDSDLYLDYGDNPYSKPWVKKRERRQRNLVQLSPNAKIVKKLEKNKEDRCSGKELDRDQVDREEEPITPLPNADDYALSKSGYFQFEIKSYHKVKGKKIFKCEVCQAIYRHSFSLKRHFIRNHVNLKFVSQSDLGNCCVSINQINKGVSVKEEDGEGEGDTSEVDKENTRCSSSMSSNSGENEVEPKACSGEEIFRCNLCQMTFARVFELKEHVKNHPTSPSDNQYGCKECRMKFSHKQNLVRHMQTHTAGEKPHSCKFCAKSFPTLNHKRSHEIEHQGSRWKCEFCPSSFSQIGDLKKHVKKFHVDEYIECSHCGKFFAKYSWLTEHSWNVHRERLPERVSAYKSLEDSVQPLFKSSDTSLDIADSMRLAKYSSSGYKFACTICKKRFHDYTLMCKHRRQIHQRHLIIDEKKNGATSKACDIDEMQSQPQFYSKIASNVAENLSKYVVGTVNNIEISSEECNGENVKDLAKANYCFYNLPREYDASENGWWKNDDSDREEYKCFICNCLYYGRSIYVQHLSSQHDVTVEEDGEIPTELPSMKEEIEHEEEEVEEEMTALDLSSSASEAVVKLTSPRSNVPSLSVNKTSPPVAHTAPPLPVNSPSDRFSPPAAHSNKTYPTVTFFGMWSTPVAPAYSPITQPKKQKTPIKKSFICLACYVRFENANTLKEHQEKTHYGIQNSHAECDEHVDIDKTVVENRDHKHLDKMMGLCGKEVKCTRCRQLFSSVSALHKHILQCASGLTKKSPKKSDFRCLIRKKYLKYRKLGFGIRHESTNVDDKTPERRRKRKRMTFPIEEDRDEVKKKRRISYEPGRHERRREKVNVVDMHACSGCGKYMGSITALERHIPNCTRKEELRKVKVLGGSNDSKQPPVCKYCKKQFTYTGNLLNHIDMCPIRKKLGGSINELDWMDMFDESFLTNLHYEKDKIEETSVADNLRRSRRGRSKTMPPTPVEQKTVRRNPSRRIALRNKRRLS
ncbi:DgyrCDS4389 [Dimorphilus gyrociliatus]|uniref:DgyrCDS4389 n=1 Tax=Dimorphilus gyrociliatus TaxID=2664684 RepID=A0A7I8VGI7_9ANNE|nr:DgyrCDS4389 [Dimorphilus gyrociliatus]